MVSFDLGTDLHNFLPQGLKDKCRRTKVPYRPSNSLNLFTLMKSCIGQDLSRISMPVDFNEPLSALQRAVEDLEYSYLLDKASIETSDSHRRLALVALFAISSYSTTALRSTKPFNPLLGETFECDRRLDRGFIAVAEQVSHHPPVSALWARGARWSLSQSYALATDVRGRKLFIQSQGQTFVRFADSQSVYVYGKVPTVTTILNPVTGRVQIKNVGELVVWETGSDAKCVLQFREEGNVVDGVVYDHAGRARYRVDAIWDQHALLQQLDLHENVVAEKLMWKVNPPVEEADKMHHFTRFAIELNEPSAEAPPTDSRRRPDQRLMEDGDWKTANQVKVQLEEAQRQRQKAREESGKEYQPVWFRPTPASEQVTDKDQYTFDHEYFKHRQTHNWAICPNIFDA